VKKTPLSAFARPMSKGIIAVTLEDGDFLIGVALTDGKQDIMLFSDTGKAVRFAEDEVRPMGRSAAGVRGMRLPKGQKLISLLASAEEKKLAVLTATENGYGKRTPVADYTRHGRGTQGMIAIQCSARNGKLLAAQLVSKEDEIMLITTGGVLIRTRVSEIREMGRATQGVTLINVDEGTKLSGLQRVVESDVDLENGNGNGQAEGGAGGENDSGTGGENGAGPDASAGK
jgi:DNA gyrase subunit A